MQVSMAGNDRCILSCAVKDIIFKDIEVSYFQDNMAQIGKRLETKVSETLRVFIAQPANSILRAKVEWYRSSESRGFSSMKSVARSEELRVSMWIDSNNAQGGCVII